MIVYQSKAIVRRPGNVAAVTTELAMNDVNMLDCSASYGPPPQIAVVVDEKDALRVYQSLERLGQAEHLWHLVLIRIVSKRPIPFCISLLEIFAKNNFPFSLNPAAKLL